MSDAGRQPNGTGDAEAGHDQQADDGPVFPDLPLGEKWHQSITRRRAAELEAQLQAWEREADHGGQRGPFERVALTGADVYWMVARTLPGTVELQAVVERMKLLRRGRDDLGSHGALHLDGLHLEHALLSGAHLENAYLHGAHLRHADLSNAHLEHADLGHAHLEGANLSHAHLQRTYLTHAYLDEETSLADIRLRTVGRRARLLRRLLRRRPYSIWIADVRWNGADLTVVDWPSLRRLGDECYGWWPWWRSLREAERATRAYTQLATRLRDAGRTDDADRFAYRAQVRQRGIHLLRLRFGSWLFSWLLFVIAGYGYRPLRTMFWYLAIIFGFAFLYMHFGYINGQPFQFDEALVFSVTSFHGRGFFPGTLSLEDLVTKLAAAEAVLGLFIEVSFIATFTQRYFGK